MIVKLTPQIWWGDKPSVAEAAGEVQSVINVAHRIRKPYWTDVGKLDWPVWYFKLAIPDRVAVDKAYVAAFGAVVIAIRGADKFPLLCHCRMGGHRGPTAAFVAAYMLTEHAKSAAELVERMRTLSPRFFKYHKHRVYRRTMLELMDLGHLIEGTPDGL